MDKKGSTIFISLMLGILFFFLGLALASPLQQVIEEQMYDHQLNCTDSSISNQNKAVCTSIDVLLPLFVGVLFGFAGFLLSSITIR